MRQAEVLDEIAKRIERRSGGILAVFTGSNREAVTGALTTLASKAGRELQRIDLQALISKYAGETEKNLSRVFAEAERSGAILCFDEADALFGKDGGKDGGKDVPRDRRGLLEYVLKVRETFAGCIVLVAVDTAAVDERTRKRTDYVLAFDPE